MLGSLGRLVTKRGGLEEAEPLLVEAMTIRAELLGDDQLHTALARRDLAAVLKARGEGPTAAVLRQQVEA